MKQFLKRVCIALSTITLTYCSVLPQAVGQDRTTYIHPRAEALMPLVVRETVMHAPSLTYPWIIPAIFDHESCISYKHSKCWTTEAELKNNREQGVGLGQLTRAWDSEGKLRFDNLEGLKTKYGHLHELNWATIKKRPDLQIRATVTLFNEGYLKLKDVGDGAERTRMAASVYNGGYRDLMRARQNCKLVKECNVDKWYGHVELMSIKSKKPDRRYGGLSMYDINTRYVKDTESRMWKFFPFF